MKYILVSDIHANYPALEAVLDKEGHAAEYLVLGDILGLNGFPKEVVDTLHGLDARVILGNHDKALLEYDEGHVNSDALSRYELQHTKGALTDEDIDWLLDKPYMDVFTVSGERFCITHAYPWPERASGYEPGNAGIQKKYVPSIASTVGDDYDYIFHGHTHQQYEQDCSEWGHDVHFVNPGTLGYEGHYAVFEDGEVTLKEIEWDEDRVKGRVSSLLPDDAPSVERWL